MIELVKKAPDRINFTAVIEYIDEHYDFIPTQFTNGETINEPNKNNGSCKVFSFAKLNDLSKDETLALFGKYYRDDVLKNPEGTDHQNIRNFMKFGWDGISIDGNALSRK